MVQIKLWNDVTCKTYFTIQCTIYFILLSKKKKIIIQDEFILDIESGVTVNDQYDVKNYHKL